MDEQEVLVNFSNRDTKARAIEIAQNLPEAVAWPKRIQTPQEASATAQLYSVCEQQTARLVDELNEGSGEPSRTQTDVGEYIITSVSRGHEVSLINIPTDQLPTNRSPTVTTRLPMIEAVIETYGLEEGFQRLPPLVLTRLPNDRYLILDGKTRNYAAHTYQQQFIHGYVIPFAGLDDDMQLSLASI